MTSALFKTPESSNFAPWQHRLTIGLLMLLASLIMLNSSSVVDTARDVYNAWQIASGNGFPMEGPYLGAVIHGGPVWFYILAAPLLITSSWMVMSLWVGFLTSLKYVLAYACGSRLGDRNFGLIWACLLALPNWTSINYLIFSHTNLVETTTLLSFYSLIRWQQGSERWFFVMCLAVGIGIHAHPTVYAAGVVVLPFVLKALWRRQLPWTHVAAGVMVAAAPLIPYIISQQLHQWPDIQSSQGYFETQALWQNLTGFFDVMRGALIDGPIVALRHVLGLQGLLLWLASAVLVLIQFGGLGLAIHAVLRRRPPQLGMALLAATLLIIASVALIRDVTPFYMTLVIYPPFYGLVAWGWSQGLARSGPWLARPIAAASLTFLSGFALATLEMGQTGHLFVPPRSLGNVRTHAVDEFADGIHYPAWARQKLGSFICGQPQPVHFHGYASLILEQSYALEVKMRCDAERVYMGGQGSGQHFLGISHRDARYLEINAGIVMGSLDLHEVSQVIEPGQPMPIPVGDVYPPRSYLVSGQEEFTMQFTAGPGEWLAITNLYHFWMPFSYTVSLNGQPIDPLHKTMINAYFGCIDCSADDVQDWSVTITAPNPEFVELVTFIPARPMP